MATELSRARGRQPKLEKIEKNFDGFDGVKIDRRIS
jgi:hypothetical protein